MGRFEGAQKVGIRDKDTRELLAVYPYKIEGTDDEIEANVRNWYYKQSCIAEEFLRKSYVDELTEHELKSHKDDDTKKVY
ncbi:hypothetical protein [Ruminiclostridium cellulolyticum]|uniref:Uncharacterized protein n=1 Tax=Ruminiclostridium cellulolyticum (strain ATCC 35319 / DSM 5812 / JCM 6584 / H10) TaxID=394503 RepID=B8HZZ8_RUMCH|nr:hypothetical protein [Ruminiclostridium cellulolyticum]ACL75498.1 conserved hypothetical protein [Ruminiclostridium cellulolyticum H10]